jgi:CubicO group peptidase (beta-lactamase class C family)
MISKFALAACFGALQGCTDNAVVSQCPPVSAAPPATSAAISSTLDSTKEKYKLNAIIFGAEQDGKPLVRTALGVSTTGVPATTDMHFRIGGVGWQLLSTVLLRMIEQDPVRIALTDRVSKWYPDYPNADRATVRMLAASSAGFGDYIATDAFIAEVTANPLRVWTADDLIARSVLPYQKPQFDDPGHNWKYSHTDFVVLGAVLEKASGKKYAALLQELILDPLALRDTRFQLDAAPQLPVLHTLQEGDFRDSVVWHRIAAVACNEKRDRVAGQCRTRRQYSAGLFRAWDARLPSMDRAESRVLGNVHDDGLRSDDGNVAGGNCLVERRLATGGAAERRDHHGGLEAADA